jgi:hypothetical protein
MNLKTEYDQVMEKMKIKDNELNDLKQKILIKIHQLIIIKRN